MIYIVAVVLAAALVLLPFLAGARSFGALVVSAVSGVAVLCAVSLFSAGGSSLLRVNLFTTALSALLGIPGVIGLLLLRVIALI
jgi:hypothetical protein